MALQDTLNQLRSFDVSDLDINTIGSWPAPIKALTLLLIALILAVAGWFVFVTEKRDEIDRLKNEETQLKKDFESKASDAANLELLRQQKLEMEASFGELVRQLPSDTEVPGLLEELSSTALENNLKIGSITLQPERREEFYVELPISVEVEGGYHDLATFVSGVSNLSRIVTLHDFELKPTENSDRLHMTILAKTYRYLDEEEIAAAKEEAEKDKKSKGKKGSKDKAKEKDKDANKKGSSK